jgi:hypothetical protein
MASVREELVDALIDMGADKDSATKAVDKYIEDQEAKWHHDTDDFDKCVEYIYDTQKYWE